MQEEDIKEYDMTVFQGIEVIKPEFIGRLEQTKDFDDWKQSLHGRNN